MIWKHSAFPWFLSEFDGTTVFSASGHTGVAACAPDPLSPPHIAGGSHFAPSPNPDERRGNAYLVSLIPELLSALRAAQSTLCCHPEADNRSVEDRDAARDLLLDLNWVNLP